MGKFSKNKRTEDGFCDRCKDCEKSRKKEYYYGGYDKVMSEKQESRKPYNRDYHNRMDIFKVRLRTAKQRARKRGLDFNITIETLENLYKTQGGLCYISKIPLSLEKYKHNTISIDRIDSSKGYVDGNVALCTDFINSSKSDYTLDDFIGIIKQIKLEVGG